MLGPLEYYELYQTSSIEGRTESCTLLYGKPEGQRLISVRLATNLINVSPIISASLLVP